VYPASFGKVTFDHPDHGKRNKCAACHKTDPPARIALAKESAHALCKGCHEQKAAGPTKCNACHDK
jgi:predicted CXXCH cytochrome family protein